MVNTAPTFLTGDGIVTTAIGLGDAAARSVVVAPDGKILAAGLAYIGTTDEFALVRLNADGSLDAGFGSGGKVVTPVGLSDDRARSIALQADGKIVVVGESLAGAGSRFALARYLGDGSLDADFGSGGIVVTPVGEADDSARSVAVQTDGRIVVAGYSFNGTDNDFALVRYNADGSLDTGFGVGGIVVTAFGAGEQRAYDVAVQNDGKILVAGVSGANSGQDVALARYLSDGSLDTGFGVGGRVTTGIGASSDIGFSVAVAADGKIVVAGSSDNGTNDDIALVRYTAGGVLDTSFGVGGKVTTAIGPGDDSGWSVAVQTDGRIVVAGSSSNGADNDFALVRYTAGGSLDTSFGAGGKVTTPIGPMHDIAFAVSLAGDGKIVVAGQSNDGSVQEFAIARYTASGVLDPVFDVVNRLDGAASFTEDGAAVVIDGSVVVYDAELAAAGSYAGATLTLARQGGANAEDMFGASGALSQLTQGGSLVLSGVSIGAVTQNSGGTLILTFNASATQERVNAALSAITYANSSDVPPASVTIGWAFSDGDASGALAATGTTTVAITAVNDAPRITSSAFSVAENATAVGIVAAVDPDGGGAVTFHISGGADAGLFALDAGTGALSFVSARDFETHARSYALEVTASDGITGSGPQHITVTLTDVDEVDVSTPIDSDAASNAIAENKRGLVGITAQAVDGDATNNAVRYALVGDIGGSKGYAGPFAIDGVTGVVSLASPLDRETVGATQTIFVKAASADGSAAVQSFTVDIGNVNEAPTDIALSKATVKEAAKTGTVIGLLSETDPDAGGAHTFTLLDSAGGRFALSHGQLVVADGVRLDYEQAKSHKVTIKVTDQGGLSRTETFTIAVGDVTPEKVSGDGAANTIVGGVGNDTLSGLAGSDILRGGAGRDVLLGGVGADVMTGGDGADRFDFDAVGEIGKGARHDRITDFTTAGSEVIDLSTIDANTSTKAKNDAFIFLASKGAAFTGVKGQLHWYQSGGKTLVEGDVDGNKAADFQIELTGNKTLTAGDFVL